MRWWRGRLWGWILVAVLMAWQTAQAATYAVIVGINRYRSASFRPLRYAEDDARLAREILIDYLNVPEENIRMLLGSEATRRNIAVAVKGWLAERVGPRDTAIFYFSGHGTFARDTNGDEEDGRDELMTAYDSSLIDVTFVRDDDLARWLAAVPAGEKIVLIDACHSGTGSKGIYQGDNRVKEAGVDWFSIRSATPEEIRAAEAEIDAAIQAEGLRQATQKGGEVVQLPVLSEPVPSVDAIEMTACAPDEVSMEIGLLKHGLFTYYWAEGARGAADADEDGTITFTELRDYVLRRIREFGFPQTPQLNGLPDPQWAFIGAKTLVVQPEPEEETSGAAETLASPSDESASSAPAEGIAETSLPDLGTPDADAESEASADQGSAPESTAPSELPPVLPPERVLAVEGDRVRLNIGSANGVVVGAIYRVYPWQTVAAAGGRVDVAATAPRAEVRIVEVALDNALAEVLESSAPVQPNDAVVLYRRPAEVDRLVVRVLVDPEDASQAAQELAEALRRLLSQEEGFRPATESDVADRLIVCQAEGGRVQVTLANPQLGRPVKEVVLAQDDSVDKTARAAMDQLRPSLQNAFTRKMLAALQNPDSPIRLGLRGPQAAKIGETISLEFTPNVDSYVLVVNVATDGSTYILFPNAFAPEAFVRAGTTVRIPTSGWRIRVQGPPGTERVKVIASTEPFDFGGIDLRRLAEQKIYALSAEESGRVIRQFALKILRDRAVSTWGTETITFPVGQAKDPMELYSLE